MSNAVSESEERANLGHTPWWRRFHLPPVGGFRTPQRERNGEVSKSTRNSGKPWKPADVKQLEKLADENTPTRVIGLKLGRTPAAVYKKASEESIPLKPTNQSPYGKK